MEQMSPEEKKACDAARERIFKSYADTIPEELPGTLPPSRGVEHTIELAVGATPTRGHTFRKTGPELKALDEEVAKMLKLGWIRPSRSPFSASPLFVKKPDGTLRLVVDYRLLNGITIKNRYPLPLASELFDATQGARYFSKIDLRTGFHQIRVAEADRHKTAFSTPFGHYEYNVLAMGLCNAPATFMQLMNDTFRSALGKYVLVYLDDILVYSKTLKEHEEHVAAVFEKLRQQRLYAKRSKCELFLAEVDFLGHRLGRGRLGTNADKVQAVQDWPVPTRVRHVRSFLGLVNFYRKFIPHCSQVAKPLTDLTKGRAPWHGARSSKRRSNS